MNRFTAGADLGKSFWRGRGRSRCTRLCCLQANVACVVSRPQVVRPAGRGASQCAHRVEHRQHAGQRRASACTAVGTHTHTRNTFSVSLAFLHAFNVFKLQRRGNKQTKKLVKREKVEHARKKMWIELDLLPSEPETFFKLLSISNLLN